MALLAESKRIAAEFEFSDDHVRKAVVEFMREMGMYLSRSVGDKRYTS